VTGLPQLLIPEQEPINVLVNNNLQLFHSHYQSPKYNHCIFRGNHWFLPECYFLVTYIEEKEKRKKKKKK